jgi:DNA-binding beta-propeller fold protein YncE
VPSLLPATEIRTLLPGGNVGSVAVGNGIVYATVAPQVIEGTPPPASGTLHRLGQHLEPGVATTVTPGARNLAVDPLNKWLYAVTQNDSVRRYDAETLQQLAAAPIGSGAWDVAVTPGGKVVYVSRWQVIGGAVFVLKADDLSQLALLTKSPTTPGFHGTLGLAADPDGKRAYVARSFRSGGPGGPVVTGHSIVVARPAGGFAVVDSTLSEPLIQPVDVAVDAPAGLVFLACLGGGGVHPRLLIFNRDGVPALQGTVLLPGSARAVAALPGTGMAYVATDDGLCLVDGKARTLELTLPLGPAPTVIAVDPDSGATFVGDRVDGTVRRVDTAAILG